jgi:hypothetical protein
MKQGKRDDGDRLSKALWEEIAPLLLAPRPRHIHVDSVGYKGATARHNFLSCRNYRAAIQNAQYQGVKPSTDRPLLAYSVEILRGKP